MSTKKFNLIAILLILTLSTTKLWAQDQTGEKQKKEMTKFNDANERKGVKFKVIPGPFYDPSIKYGMFLAPMLTYYPSKGDMISPASTTAFYGIYTSNNSYIIGMNNELYLKEDTWRLKLRAGYGNLNKDLSLYGVDENGQLDYSQKTVQDVTQEVRQLETYAMHKVVPSLYMGLGYTYKSYGFTGNTPEAVEALENNDMNGASVNHGLALKLDYDTRDNVQFPYKGYYMSYTGTEFFSEGQNNNAYFSNNFKMMGFWSLTKNHRHIIATKVYGNILVGDVQKQDFSIYGRINGDVQRGYQSGTHTDKNALNVEVEYRYTSPLLNNKLGFIAMVGDGKVFGYYNNFTDAEHLPVVALGIRYAILPYERINIRFDTTYGKDGMVWYFGIREAF
ncbi:BamA/TamA family outer membrane protein [Flammeovirga sp. SubArs3]|uniref:BamA/TamA family outer membrane protein n=1 Tax=Flammeovirga sp. SubArs3 TaxID=2995316 RepID=UPI00248BBB82|nr:BamA/TamA family outer membrane protein [Flammeovirga sp. SubArs3]